MSNPPKQYVNNKLTNLHQNKAWCRLKSNDKLIYYHLVPLLRVKESTFNIRGHDFIVEVGSYIFTQRKLAETLSMSPKNIQNGIKRLEKHRFLFFEPILKFNRSWGMKVTKKDKKTGTTTKCKNSVGLDVFNLKNTIKKVEKKFVNNLSGTPNKKTGTPTTKKRVQQQSVKIDTDHAQKSTVKKDISEKRVHQNKKTGTTINKSVHENKKDYLLLETVQSTGDTFLEKFKPYKKNTVYLEMSAQEMKNEFIDIVRMYFENKPSHAPIGTLEQSLANIDYEKAKNLSMICFYRGWLEQRDQDGELKTQVWPKWNDLINNRDYRKDHASKGYEYFMEKKKKQDLEDQKKRIELAERDRINSDKETEMIHKQVLDYVECIGSKADNLRLTANSKAFAALGLHTKTELEIKAIKERKSYRSLYNQLLIQEVLHDKQHRKEFYSGDFKIFLFQKEKKKYEADIFCYEAVK